MEKSLQHMLREVLSVAFQVGCRAEWSVARQSIVVCSTSKLKGKGCTKKGKVARLAKGLHCQTSEHPTKTHRSDSEPRALASSVDVAENSKQGGA